MLRAKLKENIDEDNILINVELLEKIRRLRINRFDEKYVRKAAKYINSESIKFKRKFPTVSKERVYEYLLLEITKKMFKMKEGVNISSNDFQDINNLLGELEELRLNKK